MTVDMSVEEARRAAGTAAVPVGEPLPSSTAQALLTAIASEDGAWSLWKPAARFSKELEELRQRPHHQRLETQELCDSPPLDGTLPLNSAQCGNGLSGAGFVDFKIANQLANMPDFDFWVVSFAVPPERKPAKDLAVVVDPVPVLLRLDASPTSTLLQHPANVHDPDCSEGRHAYAARAGSWSSSLKAVVKSSCAFNTTSMEMGVSAGSLTMSRAAVPPMN